MKKRKILYLFPLAALVLSGCTFQEGWETAKNWTNDKVFTPVVQFFKDILGIEDKKEEKKDDKPSGGGDQSGDQSGDQGEDEGEAKSVTVEEAIALCDAAGSGNVTALLRVTGVVSFGATKNNNGWTGKFESEGEKVLNFDSVRTEEEYANIDGATIVIEGYAELYNGSYKVGYLPASVSPTGEKYNPQLISLTPAQQKEISSISSVEGPAQVFVGAEVTVNQVTVNVVYSDQSTGQVRPDRVELDTSVANDAAVLTAYVGNLSGTCLVKVIENSALTPEQVIAMCDDAGSGNVVEGELTIVGIVADGAEKNNYGQWVGEFETEGEKKLTFDSAKPVEGLTVESLSGKIMTLKGYAELYNGVYKVGYLPANVSPTGAKYNPTILKVEEEQVEITGVEVNPSSLELEVGEQAALSATVNPAKASQDVTWTVDNGNSAVEIVSYENGKVVALAEGTAIVTATSVADPTKYASCEVTVTEATKELLSIAITGTPKTEYDEGEAYTAEGLKVMAHYNVGDDEDVTANATIELSKETAELSDTSFTVTASYGTAEPVEFVVNVTVAEVNQIKEAYEEAASLSSGSSSTEKYTFKGVIVGKRGTDDFYVQSGQYGIDVYQPSKNGVSEDVESALAVGKEVKVKAAVKNFSNTYETGSIDSLEILGDGNLPNPIIIASAAIQNDTNYNLLASVTGIATADVGTQSGNYSLVLKVGSDNITVYVKKALLASFPQLATIKAGDTVEVNNVVTGAYNANKQLQLCEDSTMVVTKKEIASITSVTGPAEVAVNGTISTNDVTVAVEYTDGSSGNATVTSVTVDTTSAGQKTADVTIEGWNETLHFDITVSSTAPQVVEITITASDGTAVDGGTAGAPWAITKNDISVGATGTLTSSEMRIFKNKTLTISTSSGTMTSVVMTCTANGTTKQGPGCWGTGAPSGYTFETDGKKGTWTGSESSLSFTAIDNQVRITTLVITISK